MPPTHATAPMSGDQYRRAVAARLVDLIPCSRDRATELTAEHVDLLSDAYVRGATVQHGAEDVVVAMRSTLVRAAGAGRPVPAQQQQACAAEAIAYEMSAGLIPHPLDDEPGPDSLLDQVRAAIAELDGDTLAYLSADERRLFVSQWMPGQPATADPVIERTVDLDEYYIDSFGYSDMLAALDPEAA